MELNAEQERAVKAELSPILVIAPAGTGKTRVLTERIIYLIEEGIVRPDEVLAITFTNLAANEMVNRVGKRIKDKHKIPDAIGTIHSLFAEILRKDIGLVCRNRNFNFEVVYGEFQDSVLRKALRRSKTDSKYSRYHLQDLKELISRYKISTYLEENKLSPIELNKVQEVFPQYEKLLEDKNLLDYDDILIFVDRLFSEIPAILEFWKDKYKAILVDELQDVNEIQFRIIKKLISKEKPNFFAVGDPNQCIFIFAGAKENIFEEFRTLLTECHEIELVTNYRSVKDIVDYSNTIKVLNRPKIAKSASSEKGQIIRVGKVEDSLLKDLLCTENIELSKWAVLFRHNADSKFLIELLIENGIPFRTSYFSLLDDPVIEKIINYLRLIYFDNSKPLKTILWTKDVSLDTYSRKEIASNLNFPETTLFDYLMKSEAWKDLPITDASLANLEKFITKIKRLRGCDKSHLAALVEEILPEIFLRKIAPSSREKINLFIKWLKNIQKEKGEAFSEEILCNLRYYAEITKEDINAKRHNYLTLSTIHKTKGLEWENVVILKYDALAQSSRAISDDKYLEYVAITRAKNALYLC
ncbi:DNA helicase UvrD [Candidatus Mycoplasma haematobovis]|uniref:DNA 3'-5' helicase n=1 Tax=Candidatus Mycoplasma haematobovis TaxID=432608 RepID=A0A1A9QFP2_9MOLU|nr:ATP-dependent helicase [Candidatus Mycoplasma haematobovis]OAL10766.1 DNA helicase UvrD [Candidatus Mycoplasma haematobovis]